MKAQFFFLAIIVLGLAFQANALVLSGSTYVQAGCLHAVPMHFNLFNDSESRQSIRLSVSGENASWVGLTQTNIALEAGQGTEVVAFVKPDCGAADGNYLAGVYANDLEIALLTIEAKSARSVSVSVAPISAGAKQCQSASYNVTVSNSGQLEENVLVSVSGIPEEWLSFSRPSIILAAGSQKQMELKAQVPCDARAGAVQGIVSAQYGGRAASADFFLDVSGTQSVSISLPESLEACREEGSSMSGTITNNSGSRDALELSVPGFGWVKPEPGSFVIDAGETRVFDVAVQKNSLEPKKYLLELNVKSAKFGSSQAKQFSVALKSCYALEVNEEYAPRKACIGEKAKFAFVLKNAGQKDIDAIVSLSGITVANAQRKELVKPGAMALEEFWLDTNREKPGKKDLRFRVSSQYYSADRNLGFELEDCNKGAAGIVSAATGNGANKPGLGTQLSGLVTGVRGLGLKTIASILLGIIILALLVYLAAGKNKSGNQDLGGIAREIKRGSKDYPATLKAKARKKGKGKT